MGATGYQERGYPAWEPLAFPELLENRPRGEGGPGGGGWLWACSDGRGRSGQAC